MVALNNPWRFVLVLALALGCVAAFANSSGVMAPAVFAGPITAVSSTSLTVQGVSLGIAASTQIFGLDSANALVTLTPVDLFVNETVTVYAEDANNAATADVIFAGEGFHFTGQITTLVTGTSGPTQVTLDGVYVVDVSHALWMEDFDPGSIQVGSNLQFWGIAGNGVFAAAFGGAAESGQAGGSAMENGFILTPTLDSQGAVISFTMTSKGTVYTIVLDPTTVITGKGSNTSGLKAGVHVKVWGTFQSDGSVLASKIVIKGGSRS